MSLARMSGVVPDQQLVPTWLISTRPASSGTRPLASVTTLPSRMTSTRTVWSGAGQSGHQHRAARRDGPPRHSAAGVLVDGRDVRRARAGADPRGRAHPPDEPLR